MLQHDSTFLYHQWPEASINHLSAILYTSGVQIVVFTLHDAGYTETRILEKCLVTSYSYDACRAETLL